MSDLTYPKDRRELRFAIIDNMHKARPGEAQRMALEAFETLIRIDRDIEDSKEPGMPSLRDHVDGIEERIKKVMDFFVIYANAKGGAK